MLELRLAAFFGDLKEKKRMRAFRAVLVIAFFVAFLAGPAFAQQKSVPKYGEETKDKTDQEKEAEKAAERAYKRSLGNIPDQGPTDPWGTVRGNNDAPKASAAKGKKTTKSGSVN
jgi:hypothetical protein